MHTIQFGMQKSQHQNKIPKAFTVALLFAMLFWLLIKMSREYKTVVSFPVEYVNIPQDKLIQKPPLKAVDIQIRASGFRLFGLNLMSSKIELDARKLKRKSAVDYYFLMQQQKMSIQNQITKKYILEQFVLDTLYVNLGTLASKKVPVVGDFDLSYKLGYHLMDTIKVTPDSIIVSGPEEQLDTLQRVHLKKLIKDKVFQPIRATLKIKKLSKEIKYNIEEASVSGEVDRFTEGTLQLPFEIINMPDSISINTFPTSVKLVFQVGLNNFTNVKTSSFKVVADYQYAINNKLNYFIPKVMYQPSFVTSARIVPAKIEYLIKKE